MGGVQDLTQCGFGTLVLIAQEQGIQLSRKGGNLVIRGQASVLTPNSATLWPNTNQCSFPTSAWIGVTVGPGYRRNFIGWPFGLPDLNGISIYHNDGRRRLPATALETESAAEWTAA